MKNYTKKIVKYSIIVILICLLLPTIIFLGKNSNKASAGKTADYLTFEGFHPEAETGTKENPFLILEIVPYRGMGQIGYIIGGQEPVDPNLANPTNGIAGALKGFAEGAFIDQPDGSLKNTEIFKKQVLHIAEENISNYYIRVVTITPAELNENVAKFTKYYDLNYDGKNTKEVNGETESGEIDLIGNADLISISTMAQAGNPVIDLWETYGRDKSGISTSSNRYDRGFLYEDLNWQTTMELFMKTGVVEDSAALVYDISCFTAPPSGSEVSKHVQSFITSASGTGYSNNVYKLCLMLRQRDPAEVYNLYMNTNDGTETALITEITMNGMTTGSYNSHTTAEAKVFWNEYSFLPSYPDGTFPADLTSPTKEYENYMKDSGFIINWIAGEVHDSVIRNTYSYNGTSSIVQYFTSYEDWISLKETNIASATTPFQYNAELFDYLEDKNTSANRPSKASPCDAVEYILHRPKNKNKSSITILDIEPCNDFSLSVSEVRKMLPAFTGIIWIKQQTTAEFIGKTEDLNDKYDLIYVGTNTGKMKVKDGKTSYNDPLLDGFVYLHVGDRMVGYDTLKGNIRNENGNIVKAFDFINFKNELFNRQNILKSYKASTFPELLASADFYRYAGNDITTIKNTELKEYIDAGFPLLLENDLYIHNNSIVDDKSNIYEFLLTCKQSQYSNQIYNKKDFTTLSPKYHTSQVELTKLLQKEKLSIYLSEVPSEYNAEDDSTLILDRTLNYKFNILTPSDGDNADLYEWKIYVDVNADGRFTDTERILGDISCAGEITCSKSLSPEYTGVIPWKLEVKSCENKNIRTAKTGFAAFKIPTMSETEKEKTQINILQITSNDSTLNLEELMNPGPGKTSLFYRYTKDLDDFNVNITTVSVDEFMGWYKNGKMYESSKPETDKLEDYDMLLFGFGDCYSDISNECGALGNVQAFINSGRSVMFTHDTTSFVNLPKEEFKSLGKNLTFWGYGFNRYVRNIAGLDRFDVLKQASGTAVFDKAFMPSQIQTQTSGNTIYKNSLLTNAATTYPEIQGLTNGCLVAFSNPGNYPFDSIHNANKDYPPFISGNTITKGTAIDNYHTTFVTKMNEGQITSYPYDIPDGFEISNTHLQYYQINMDDPEIVVWFCLSDKLSNEYPTNESFKKAMDHSNETGPYSTSPNDARNNYYIYSKGNIMYTGVGHSSMDAVTVEGEKVEKYKENEVKLFINTMIAAYSAGIEPPTVEITNKEAAKNSSDDYILYEYSEKPDDLDENKKKIFFIANDSNLLSDELVVRFYSCNNPGATELINPDTFTVYDSLHSIAAAKYHEPAEEDGYTIKAGKEYYFDYPLVEFGKKGYDQVIITVTNKEKLKGSTKVILLSRSLYDLD